MESWSGSCQPTALPATQAVATAQIGAQIQIQARAKRRGSETATWTSHWCHDPLCTLVSCLWHHAQTLPASQPGCNIILLPCSFWKSASSSSFSWLLFNFSVGCSLVFMLLPSNPPTPLPPSTCLNTLNLLSYPDALAAVSPCSCCSLLLLLKRF